MWEFDCPEGCVWLFRPKSPKRKKFDGVACPTHKLFCKRRGGPTLWPYWKIRPKEKK